MDVGMSQGIVAAVAVNTVLLTVVLIQVAKVSRQVEAHQQYKSGSERRGAGRFAQASASRARGREQSG